MRFPAYRLALVSDYSAEDVEAHKQANNGDPCLAVASGDVDGDGVQDFAFLLTSNSKHTILVAARSKSSKDWVLTTLRDFGNDGPQRIYVGPIERGSYQDLFASDHAPSDYVAEPGRVRSFKAKHAGFIAGGIESSGVAFFFTGKRWVHLWLSD